MDHNKIVEQREKVEAAYQAWMRSEPAFEEAAWMEYQAEQMKMDALIKREKVNA